MSERNDPAILFVKPKAIRTADKTALKRAGVLVIEVDDPQSIKFTRAYAEIDSFVLLKLAMKTIAETKSYENARERLGTNISTPLSASFVE